MNSFDEAWWYKRILTIGIMQHIYSDSGTDRRSSLEQVEIAENHTITTMINYLTLLLGTTAALISVEAKIPAFIKICKRNDPQINKCIENSILGLRDKLVEGIPELEVPKLDPLTLGELKLNLGTGVKAEGRDLLLSGTRDFKIDNLVVDPNADSFAFNITIPKIEARGSYYLDATVASIPLKGDGPIFLSVTLLTGQGTLHGKKVTRGGKTLYYFPNMDLKLQIKDYHVRLENLFERDPTIGEVLNKLLNEEKESVMASLLPELEKAVVKRILLIANNICKHFTWNELFPES